MSLSARQRQLVLLELGVERAAPWRAHPALRLVVVRRVADGNEQRVLFSSFEARESFLQEQRKTLREVRREFRRNLNMQWMEAEP